MHYQNEKYLPTTVYTLWISFTFIYAYYVGAFTMMFVVEDKVPFTNLKEALAEFPKWKMIFSQGAESHFELPARRVSSMYK